MKKQKMVQVGSNLPNCPKCKNGNAMIDHIVEYGEMVWTCRDCGFEVNNDDTVLLFLDFDSSKRQWVLNHDEVVNCGDVFNPNFDKLTA